MKTLMLGLVLGMALPLSSLQSAEMGRNVFRDVRDRLDFIAQDSQHGGGTHVMGEPTPLTSTDISGGVAGPTEPCTSSETCVDSKSAGCQKPCCPEFWQHRAGVFIDLLVLSPGNVDFAYAIPVDGTTATSVPIGAVAVAEPTYNTGFRVGAKWALNACSSLVGRYSWYHSRSTDSRALTPGSVGANGPFFRSLTVHPNTVDVSSDSLRTKACYDIDFQLADLEYKRLLHGTCNTSVNYVLGVRYAHLDEDFAARYTINGATDVTTDIDFDGGGPRVGLLGERLLTHGLLIYANAHASFLVGNFNASYRQFNAFDLLQAQSAIDDQRIVSQLELELGLGWQDACGRCRITAGYLIQAWYNTMTTPAYVRAVQTQSFEGIKETLTFDGLTLRAEYRF